MRGEEKEEKGRRGKEKGLARGVVGVTGPNFSVPEGPAQIHWFHMSIFSSYVTILLTLTLALALSLS